MKNPFIKTYKCPVCQIVLNADSLKIVSLPRKNLKVFECTNCSSKLERNKHALKLINYGLAGILIVIFGNLLLVVYSDIRIASFVNALVSFIMLIFVFKGLQSIKLDAYTDKT